jgi:acyl dehydratase
MRGRYFEDFAVGQTFGSGQLRVDKEQIKAFAAEFDPQPFHLDPQLGGWAVEIRTWGHSPSVVPYSSYSNPSLAE